MTAITFLRTIGVLALLIDLGAIVYKKRPIQYLAKTTASLSFVLAAYTVPLGDTSYEYRMRLAFILSFVGDVLLLFKDEKAFLVGLWSFALGHLFFTSSFLHQGWDLSQWLTVFAMGTPPAWVVREWLGRFLKPSMRTPVDIYMLVITGMVASAAASLSFTSTPKWQIAGAFLFYLSDLTVARETFVKPGPLNAIIGLPLYYGAQWCFVATLGGSPVS